MNNWEHVDGGEKVTLHTDRNRTISVICDDIEDGAFISVGPKAGFGDPVSAYLSPEILDKLIVHLVEAKLKREGKND